jgi:hypothetical protein
MFQMAYADRRLHQVKLKESLFPFVIPHRFTHGCVNQSIDEESNAE